MRHPLQAICPYFAMFPEEFARGHIEQFTVRGDLVFDPFSGRGTTAFEAVNCGRQAGACDVNPVAYCITAAKVAPPKLADVLDEIARIERAYSTADNAGLREIRRCLPEFFGRAFHWCSLEQLLFLRQSLEWRESSLHRFITALVLGSLHGDRDKSPSYFSNQMPRTISPKPAYAVRYWRKNNLWPHKRDVFGIIKQRAEFRLRSEVPSSCGIVKLCDVRDAHREFVECTGKVKAVVTSPPYFNVTNYEEDQWLRLWFLGGEPHPTYGRVSRDDRYTDKHRYWCFLSEAWKGIAPLLRSDAVLVCRMGGCGMSCDEITEGLLTSVRQSFENARLLRAPQESEIKGSQTHAFRPGSKGCKYEWDYVIRLESP